jgi:hypothetical protein
MRKMMMELTIFFCLVLSASVAGAATLTSVSGTISDGQVVTIKGSGFGTSPTDTSFLDFEKGAVGSAISETRWTGSTPSRTVPGPITIPKYSNLKAHNGKQAITCAFKDPTYGCLFSLGYTEPIDKVYVSYWFYSEYITFPTKKYFQWKMFRVMPESNVIDQASTFMISQWPNEDGTCRQAYHANIANPTTPLQQIVPDKRIFRTCFPRGEWIRIELFLEESDLGVANGTEMLKYYSTNTNTWTTWSNYSKNVMTREATDKRWKWMHFGHYVGNGGTGFNVNIYWDNVYVQRGTYARFELCDSSSWSTCNNREVQAATGWSTTGATIRINTGTFERGKTVYLFFIDDAGNASKGFPVTIGATIGATKSLNTLRR